MGESNGGSSLFRKRSKHVAPTRFNSKMRKRKNSIENF